MHKWHVVWCTKRTGRQWAPYRRSMNFAVFPWWTSYRWQTVRSMKNPPDTSTICSPIWILPEKICTKWTNWRHYFRTIKTWAAQQNTLIRWSRRAHVSSSAAKVAYWMKQRMNMASLTQPSRIVIQHRFNGVIRTHSICAKCLSRKSLCWITMVDRSSFHPKNIMLPISMMETICLNLGVTRTLYHR